MEMAASTTGASGPTQTRVATARHPALTEASFAPNAS